MRCRPLGATHVGPEDWSLLGQYRCPRCLVGVLTCREKDVLRRVLQGESRKATADRYDVSVKRVTQIAQAAAFKLVQAYMPDDPELL